MAFNCPHCNKGIEDVIPKSRFDEINTQKKQAQQALEALKTESAAAGPEVNELRDQVAQLGRKLEEQAATTTDALIIARAGITDPEDAADMLAIYKRRGGDVSLSDWIGNAESLPRSAAALLPKLAAPAQAPAAELAPAAPAQPVAAQPVANRGTTAHPPGSQTFSSDQISKMSVEEYRANRAAILRSLAGH